MVEKQSKNGDSGAAVAVTDPGRVRNVVLVGPSGSGKTTLTEALLAASGTVSRAGSVVDGTTVCDHDPAAVRQQRSVGLSVAPVLHNGFKINFIDTPGYADFVGEPIDLRHPAQLDLRHPAQPKILERGRSSVRMLYSLNKLPKHVGELGSLG